MKTRDDLISALENAYFVLAAHPLVNEQIVAEIRQGKYELATSIGGDMATISEAVAIIREALEE